MSVQTNHYKLTKDSSNDFYNVDTINQNLDKIDKGMNDNKNEINTKSNKTHNHNSVYEPVISKKTGFNLDKSDSLTNSSTNTLATSNAIKTLNDKLKEVNKKLEEKSTVEFETNGSTVTSFPSGAKGLFSPVVEGREPWNNLVDMTKIKSVITSDTHTLVKGTDRTLLINPCIRNLVKDKTYTLLFKVTNIENITSNQLMIQMTGGDTNQTVNCNKGINKIVFQASSENTGLYFFISTGEPDNATATFSRKIMIIEGDYSNKELHYVEGFIPTSQSYELESIGKNKLDVYKIKNSRYANVTPIKDGEFILEGTYYAEYPIGCIKKDDKIRYTADVEAISGVPTNYFRLEYTDGTLDSNIPNGIDVVAEKDVKCIYLYCGAENSQKMKYSNAILEIDKGQTLGVYEPYAKAKAEFSIPPNYSLLSGSYIDEDGNYHAKWKRTTLNGEAVQYPEFSLKKDNIVIFRFKWLDTREFWNNLRGLFKTNNTLHLSRNNISFTKVDQTYSSWTTPYLYRLESNNLFLSVKTSDLISSDTAGVIDYLSKNPLIMNYQLIEKKIFKDGQEGYKAPQPINIYEGGDGVVRGTHTKRYQLSNAKVINLSQEVESIDYVKGEVDGQIQELEYTLTNSTTITLTQAYTGHIDVKGYLPSSDYINPNIKGRLSASLGDMAVKTSKEVADLNEHLVNEEADNNLALINHEMDINVLKECLEDTNAEIGDKTQLNTSNKSNLVSAVNEVFQYGNNVKNNTVDALLSVDDSLSLTHGSAWSDVISQIGNISTGKKWAKGETTSNGSCMFLNLSNNNYDKRKYIEITNLTFRPSLICIFNKANGNYEYYIYDNQNTYDGRKFVYAWRVYDVSDLIYNNGFKLPVATNDKINKWMAFE